MTEATNEILTINGLPLPSRKTRRAIVVSTLLFCWSLIAYVVIGGDGNNSLHTSALAWAFATSVTVIFAYVFGAVADNFNFLKAQNTQLQITTK
jgi:hypothetical protein